MTVLNCKVTLIQSITDTIYRIFLLPEIDVNFRAGQYLITLIKNYDNRSFSLASTPEDKRRIELHIRASNIDLYAMEVVNYIQNNKDIIIDIPYGKAWLRDDNNDKPLILIAGGTGFSYIRSILLTTLKCRPNRKISVYWGGRELKDLYLLEELNQLIIKYKNVKIIPIINNKNNVHYFYELINAVINDFNQLNNHEIYIGANFKMAIIARDIFHDKCNAIITQMYSDAFFIN